jgi:tripartite-type tricarboxylate transporter receptor subunit TctC
MNPTARGDKSKSLPLALIANPSFPAKSVAAVIALAKQQPGKLNLGTSESSGYLWGELFKAAADIDVAIIRYKGTASVMNDLIGGQVQVAFAVLPPVLGNIRAGNLRTIAVTSAKRSSLLPDVPTFDESGLPGFEAVQYYGLLAPAGTPQKIIDKLSIELRKLVDADDVRQRIRTDGGDPMTSTSAEYTAQIDKEEAKWSTLVRRLNLKVE